ncbi:MAG TPA: hypothetical protein VFH31_02405 [Pyrinomonadaceae bacterium]|nr:hypothetical protein [Pyrinomonadaceae bacterium]
MQRLSLMVSSERLQIWLLRLTGLTEILAFIAVVMPRSWMEISHEWLGLGEMPGGPIIMFMIRQASYAYGMHGISLFILASNITRFRPLIIFNGISFLLAGLVFFLIDYTYGMPLWWTLVDSLGCGFFGAAVLWLNRDWIKSNFSDKQRIRVATD